MACLPRVDNPTHDDTLIFLFEFNRKRTPETLSTCDPVKRKKCSLLSNSYSPPSLLHFHQRNPYLHIRKSLLGRKLKPSVLVSCQAADALLGCLHVWMVTKNKFTSAPVCRLQWHQVGPSVERWHVAPTLPGELVTDEKDGLPFCQGNSLAG